MANKPMIIPGGYITQYDKSITQTSTVRQIGAVFIGPTLKGPAFIPFNVMGIDNAIHYFGNTYEKFYTMYAIQNYLNYANSCTVVRTLWQNNYSGSYFCIKQINKNDCVILGKTNG